MDEQQPTTLSELREHAHELFRARYQMTPVDQDPPAIMFVVTEDGKTGACILMGGEVHICAKQALEQVPNQGHGDVVMMCLAAPSFHHIVNTDTLEKKTTEVVVFSCETTEASENWYAPLDRTSGTNRLGQLTEQPGLVGGRLTHLLHQPTRN